MNYNKRFKIGDTIARLTKMLGIPHCLKCEKRRLILNDAQELGLRETIKKLADCCKE